MPQPQRGFRKWKKIGIVGSRRRANFADRIMLEEVFVKLYKMGDKIVSGGCKSGADYFAEGLAKKYKVPIIIHHANWDEYGAAAGPIRNSLIAEDCDMLIAMVAQDRTGGTEDTVKKTVRLNKIVLLILHDGTVTDAPVRPYSRTSDASAESEESDQETETDE